MRVQAPPPIIMEIIEVEQKKMDALRVLSDVNMKISQAREELSTVDSKKDQYFEEREKEAIERISSLLKESQYILKEAGVNFDEIHLFAQSINSFAGTVTSFYERLLEIEDLFKERAKEFNQIIGVEEEKAKEIKNQIKIDRIQIEGDRRVLVEREKELVKRETKVKDLAEMTNRDIIRLKQGRI